MSASLRHLTSLADLNRATITDLLDQAQAMHNACAAGVNHRHVLAGRTVLNLFFEPSTRTRTSFELAARRLGADVVNFNIALSSTNKGETLIDTLHTLEAMHLDAIVVRHKLVGTPDELVRNANSNVAIVNAGDGTRAHPTQGLLDALTIRQHHGDLAGLKVSICGDIRHSRVARSDIQALTTLGVRDIRLCGPAALLPDADEFPHCHYTGEFDAAIEGADVAIMLRLQKERMAATQLPDTASYFAHYGLTAQRLARAAPNCMVMHPGPINRGIEIDSAIADGPQSCILQQVANGVFVRMAVLAAVMAERRDDVSDRGRAVLA